MVVAGLSSVQKYMISVKRAEYGKISPVTCQVLKGGNKTFTITANKGYKIADVLIDAKSIGNVSAFTDVKANDLRAKTVEVHGRQQADERCGRR